MRPILFGLVFGINTIALAYVMRRLRELRRLEARIQKLEAAGASVHASVRRIDFEDEGMDPRWTADQRARVRKGRTLLFQAAQFARSIAESSGDPDRVKTQEWLIGHVRQFAADAFGPPMAREIDGVLDRRTDGPAGTTPADRLRAIADCLEHKISVIRPEDLDTIASAPESFRPPIRP